ncbi:Acetyltransferase (GNAT) domain-containing protein [Bacillus sp. 491mf]|uniref:GNAT family N-acetyltransferase n=1 Tax=Bacillus sp. 491mf TaxID=1761755 RepID=UPI0008E0A877|nr:GNAT family protein [Bacillus sp. 491mf]SFD08184.1 Acetyltransferase (GNAT) domain-containing protein [Bacillus sp. 491mf]
MNIHNLTLEEAREINTWQYEAPYELYSFTGKDETLKELLDGTYYGVCDEQDEFIGYFCFGDNAQVPGGRDAKLYTGERIVDIGLGMKPALTGKGLGISFLQAGLRFAKEEFRPEKIRLSVAVFNERAIHLYMKMGFQKGVVFMSRGREFVLMEYELK